MSVTTCWRVAILSLCLYQLLAVEGHWGNTQLLECQCWPVKLKEWTWSPTNSPATGTPTPLDIGSLLPPWLNALRLGQPIPSPTNAKEKDKSKSHG